MPLHSYDSSGEPSGYGGRRTPPQQPQPDYYSQEQHQYPQYHQQQQYQPYQHPQPQQQQQQQLPQHRQPQPQPSQQPPLVSPGAHPDSSFNRLRAARRYSRERDETRPLQNYGEPVSPVGPTRPQAPPHRDTEGRYWGRELGYTNSAYSNITPGADNFGETAAGGITGIAMGVADANARESGLEAMRNTPGYDPRDLVDSYHDSPYGRPEPQHESSHSSLTPLGAAAFPVGVSTPQARSMASRSPQPQPQQQLQAYHDPYTPNAYSRYSRTLDPSFAGFDPNSIEDDGDDGLDYRQSHAGSGSMLSLGHHSDRGAGAAAPVVAGGAAAGGLMGTLGGLVGRTVSGNTQSYGPVHPEYAPPAADAGLGGPEKSEWLSKQSSGKKKLRWIIGILVAVLVLGGIGGGVAGGLLSKKSSSSSSAASTTPSGQSASDDTASNGDLNKNSAEIKALLNNPNLHKVFPGIDYTPMYTQYPDCLTYPPSQNNVTRDLAVLSQLTNTIRLYGTDCNQTEMLLHSIDQLGLKGTIKVWLGVWQDTNATTNARQLEQMYSILDKYGDSAFLGVIVGNEVLFRQDMTAWQLGQVISGVRTNLTSKGYNMAVASSDLGDDWTAELANEVDYVMANIHPFFAGVTSDVAASWTWDFWQTHDTILKTDPTKNIISETGWPSAGGTDCGGAATCTTGSVAGVTQMNQFMNTWVCSALTNGTNYFWFEAFDEPWKIQFDTPGKEWEDKWGLMDVNRNLKAGVQIPSCGGKTVS